MPRIILAVAACITLLATAGAQDAAAHELTVLRPGAGQLDAGDATTPRLVHATLQAPDETLVVMVRSRVAGARAQLLVADDADARRANPAMRLERGGETREVEVLDRPRRLVDEVTGVGYLLVATVPLSRAGAAETVVVDRGGRTARVAVRVAGDSRFRTTDPRRTPRALAGLRAWADAPGAVARPGATDRARAQLRLAPWFGAFVAAAGILVAAWWVGHGRTRSRLPGRGRGDAAS